MTKKPFTPFPEFYWKAPHITLTMKLSKPKSQMPKPWKMLSQHLKMLII